jgi:hypothetical protein
LVYETQAEDIDGKVLRLGSEPKENARTAGHDGRRWISLPEGRDR